MNMQTSPERMEQINQIVTFLYQENEKLESERNLLQRIIDARYAQGPAKPDNVSFSALEALIILLALSYFVAFVTMLVEILYHMHGG